MRIVTAAIVTASIVLGACGASFSGPATSDPTDPCHGHLRCPKGCCTSASFDGEGWECVETYESSAAICKFVGEFSNPGMTGAARDATVPQDATVRPDAFAR